MSNHRGTVSVLASIATILFTAPSALAAGAPGVYVAVTDDLYTVNTGTGAATFHVDSLTGATAYDDMAYEAATDRFWGLPGPSGTTFLIDPSSGASVPGPTITAGGASVGGCEGLAFDALGDLWAACGTPYGASHFLLRVDKVTGFGTHVATLSGTADGGDGDSIEWIGGTLYLIDAAGGVHSSDTLYTVNTGTGVATAVGAIGFTSVNDMAYDAGAGVLYAADSHVWEVIVIDPATGAGTSLGPSGLLERPVGIAVIPGKGPVPVPETASFALVAAGMAAVAGVALVRRRAP